MSCLWTDTGGSYNCKPAAPELSSVEQFLCEASLKINGFAFDLELAQQLAFRTESQDIRLRSIRRHIIDLVSWANYHSSLVQELVFCRIRVKGSYVAEADKQDALTVV